MPLYGQGDLKAFQHVERVCIGAESYQYALFKQLQHGGAAHGVAHVRFGVVHHHCAGFAYYVHFRGAYVYAVPKQRLFAQNAVVQQAVHAAAAVALHGIVNVVHALANVDMEARAPAVRLNAFFKRFIAYREKRMAAEHGAEHGVALARAVIYKVLILLNGFVALLFPVALAHLIAQARAYAKRPCRIGYGKKAALYLAEACMMIEYSCAAGLYAVYYGRVCAAARILKGKVAVYLPPHAVQHLVKIGGVIARYAEPARKGGIYVRMRVYERGHYNAALRVHKFGVRVFQAHLCRCAYFLYKLVFGNYRAVFIVWLGRVSGYQSAVSYDYHAKKPP